MAADRSGTILEASLFIARPTEDIWDYLLETSNDANWRFGVEEARWTSEEPYGLGSTGLHRIERAGDMPWKLTEWEEQRVVGWDFVSGRFEGCHASYGLEPEGGGTRMTIRAEMRGSVLFRAFIGTMKYFLTRQLAGDLQRLKAIMED